MKIILSFIILTLLFLAGFVYAELSKKRADEYIRMLKKKWESFRAG